MPKHAWCLSKIKINIQTLFIVEQLTNNIGTSAIFRHDMVIHNDMDNENKDEVKNKLMKT